MVYNAKSTKLVAVVSGSICIAVVSVSGGVIVLSEQTVVVAEGYSHYV